MGAEAGNFSGARYVSGSRLAIKLGVHEHAVSASGGGSDTLAVGSSELRSRGLSVQSLGTEMILGPRKFRLGLTKSNTAVGPALLVGTEGAVDLGLGEASDLVETDNPTITGGAIGEKTVTLTSGTVFDSVVANQLAGAFLNIADDTGEGYMYGIKSNTADNGSDTITLTLYEPIVTALGTGASDFGITGNPYKRVVNTTAATDFPTGVWVSNVDADGSGVAQYGWIQVAGPALVVADAAVAIVKGSVLTTSTNHAGNVMSMGESADTAEDSAAEAIVGFAMAAATDTGHVPVWLTLG